MRRALGALDDTLFELWGLGENMILGWTRAGDDLLFLAVRHYAIVEALTPMDREFNPPFCQAGRYHNVDERSHTLVIADNVRCGRIFGAAGQPERATAWRCGGSGERRPSAAIGAAREAVWNTQAAWNRSSRRAGARVGKPRWARIRTITGGSSMAAMIFTAPPQFGQCSMSIAPKPDPTDTDRFPKCPATVLT